MRSFRIKAQAGKYESILHEDGRIFVVRILLHKMQAATVNHFTLVSCLFTLVLAVLPEPNIDEDEYSAAEWLLTTKPGLFGLIGGYANPTGIVLIIILVIMFVCSQPFVRRGGSFEVILKSNINILT